MNYFRNRARRKAYSKVKPAFRIRTFKEGSPLPPSEAARAKTLGSSLLYAAALTMLGGLFLIASSPEAPSSPEGPLLILALSLFGLALPFISFFAVVQIRSVCIDVKLPIVLESSVTPAVNAINAIVQKAKEPSMCNDPQALSLAREACILYDNLLLELKEIHRLDPQSFGQTHSLSLSAMTEGNAKASWLRDALRSVGTLIEIDRKLGQILSGRIQEEAQSRQLQALEDPARKELPASLLGLKDSLSDISLREEIKKKSFLELKSHLDSLERI